MKAEELNEKSERLIVMQTARSILNKLGIAQGLSGLAHGYILASLAKQAAEAEMPAERLVRLMAAASNASALRQALEKEGTLSTRGSASAVIDAEKILG